MGKFKYALIVTLLISCLMWSPHVFPVQAQDTATIRLDPLQISNQTVNSTFTAYVKIDNAVNIEAVQVWFTYDPTVINVTNVAEGPFLPSVGPTAIGQLYAEEDMIAQPPTGIVYYSSAIMTGATASGSGILLNVTFRVLSQGGSNLHFLPYSPPVSSSEQGCFLMDINYVESYPSLEDGFYGSPISLSADPAFIETGETTTLTGEVTGSLSGSIQSVVVEFNEEGGNWTTLATLTPNASGIFIYQWTGNPKGELTIFEFRLSYISGGQTQYSPLTVVTVVSTPPTLLGYIYAGIIAIIVVIVVFSVVSFVRGRRRSRQLPILD
jgi:hypothetical protein